MGIDLYFATNRNHVGDNRWKPTGYGSKFSSDGHYNLRFGKLNLSASQTEIKKHLNKSFKNGNTGDGEKLSAYLSKQAKKATIEAYEDSTAVAKKELEFEENSSTRMFLEVKSKMQKAADVLVYIHGYNVDWNEAVGAAAALQLMLNRNNTKKDNDLMVILFSWPSDGSMMPMAAYKSDRSDARDSAQAMGRGLLKLRDFLSRLDIKDNDTWKPCNQQIHLLCHSMGNYVLQNALAKVQGYAAGNKMPRLFENIFMCAADVDDDVLEKELKMGRLHELCNHLSVYYNSGDLAMQISDYTKGNPQRLGHSGNARPQFIHNKIHQIDCSKVVNGIVEHSYYLWAMVNDDISMTLKKRAFDDLTRKRKRLANSREWELME